MKILIYILCLILLIALGVLVGSYLGSLLIDDYWYWFHESIPTMISLFGLIVGLPIIIGSISYLYVIASEE